MEIKCKNINCNNKINSNRTYCSMSCRSFYVNTYLREYKHEVKSKNAELYLLNPKLCKNCGTTIEYSSRTNNYCSHSCHAASTLPGRKISIRTKEKIRNGLINYYSENKHLVPSGSIVYINCNFCKQPILKQKRIKYCSKACRKNFRRKDIPKFRMYKFDCAFKFNLRDFPNEFNFDLIKQYGWYRPSNKGNNLNGVSRDHLYSIRDGFDNKIPCDVICHPANCKLILQKENSSKHKKSSITIEELLIKIADWNKKYNNI